MVRFLSKLFGIAFVVLVALAGTCLYLGLTGFDPLTKKGSAYWLSVSKTSPLLTRSMRIALASDAVPLAGNWQWSPVDQGFEVADLPVLLDGQQVDHVLLARIDPARYRFVVRNAVAGQRNLDQWLAHTGAALVVNGSYFSRRNEPATPFLSDGKLLGPKDYDAKAGAFVASSSFAGVRDLANEDWHAAFQGATDAMVSYPLLVASGVNRVARASRWLATRSFVGEDAAGRVIIGTTTDAFFSLDRLARFLLATPLGLTVALNLDGGPVACQGISLRGFVRKSFGRSEAQVDGDKIDLLVSWPYASAPMPIVLAVFPK